MVEQAKSRKGVGQKPKCRSRCFLFFNFNYMIELIKGDCLDIMPLIPDKSVQLILADLPYQITHCKWDSIIDLNKLWEQYNRIIKDNAAIVLFSTQPFTTKLISSNLKKYKYTWYWVKDNKGNFLNAKYQPLRQIEEINVFNKHLYIPQGVIAGDKKVRRGGRPKITLLNYKDEYTQHFTGYPSNILYYGLDRDAIHPTQKPVALLEYLIKTYTNEGDTVLDNTFGSCSTGIACLNTNRNFIGIEMDDTYFQIGVDRIEKQKKVLDNIDLFYIIK